MKGERDILEEYQDADLTRRLHLYMGSRKAKGSLR